MDDKIITEKAILYICDRRRCEKCSYPDCQFTTDIRHAANFTADKVGNMWENPNGEDTMGEDGGLCGPVS
jgi:hypothetical protein